MWWPSLTTHSIFTISSDCTWTYQQTDRQTDRWITRLDKLTAMKILINYVILGFRVYEIWELKSIMIWLKGLGVCHVANIYTPQSENLCWTLDPPTVYMSSSPVSMLLEINSLNSLLRNEVVLMLQTLQFFNCIIMWMD